MASIMTNYLYIVNVVVCVCEPVASACAVGPLGPASCEDSTVRSDGANVWHQFVNSTGPILDLYDADYPVLLPVYYHVDEYKSNEWSWWHEFILDDQDTSLTWQNVPGGGADAFDGETRVHAWRTKDLACSVSVGEPGPRVYAKGGNYQATMDTLYSKVRPCAWDYETGTVIYFQYLHSSFAPAASANPRDPDWSSPPPRWDLQQEWFKTSSRYVQQLLQLSTRERPFAIRPPAPVDR
jgi:hypothetical protein